MASLAFHVNSDATVFYACCHIFFLWTLKQFQPDLVGPEPNSHIQILYFHPEQLLLQKAPHQQNS